LWHEDENSPQKEKNFMFFRALYTLSKAGGFYWSLEVLHKVLKNIKNLVVVTYKIVPNCKLLSSKIGSEYRSGFIKKKFGSC
jgi:hypothetical protein